MGDVGKRYWRMQNSSPYVTEGDRPTLGDLMNYWGEVSMKSVFIDSGRDYLLISNLVESGKDDGVCWWFVFEFVLGCLWIKEEMMTVLRCSCNRWWMSLSLCSKIVMEVDENGLQQVGGETTSFSGEDSPIKKFFSQNNCVLGPFVFLGRGVS